MALRALLTLVVLLTCALAADVDDENTWWQLKAMDTGELLSKIISEEATGQPELSATQPSVAAQPLDIAPKKAPVVGTVNLAAANNYTAESHTVRTSDGYLLTLFRLANPGRPVVLLAHGLLSSSAEFLVLGRGRALAFLLQEAGFDVWLFNARGTTPSRRHETIRPYRAKFWDFSFHEIGVLDMPASIDFVLNKTGHTQLHYVGFGQGSTVLLVMGSERPEYMEKVKTFVGLAPVAFTRDIRSFPLRFLAVAPSKLYFVLKLVGINEFLPSSKLISFLGDMLCYDGKAGQALCTNMLFLLAGTDTDQMNTTVLPDLFANVPAGASTKQLLHFGQQVMHRHLVFRQFDYGRWGNLKKYKTSKPPDYDLAKVTAPTYLYHAENDILCVQSNIDELTHKLGNIQKNGVRKVANARFSHLDYVIGKNAKELVYDDLIDVLHKHDGHAGSTTAAGTTASSSTTTTSTTPHEHDTSAITTPEPAANASPTIAAASTTEKQVSVPVPTEA
ncbi:lipase 3-like [Frankliniella occidentalis]|uniref:Lipase 3-like n=1 Tax=Frankliniella occidentalis TaxID=133901 RepID=A0A6J1S2Q2_FRAOC|nr:lipase 3-like [Frankliniella occidentalis]